MLLVVVFIYIDLPTDCRKVHNSFSDNVDLLMFWIENLVRIRGLLLYLTHQMPVEDRSTMDL